MRKDKEPTQDQSKQNGVELREVPLSHDVIVRRVRKLKKILRKMDEAQSPQKIQKILSTVIDF